MAFQPDDCSEDVTVNGWIDFDSTAFFLADFRDPCNGLNARKDNELLYTPELETTNPFVPSTGAALNIDPNDVGKNEYCSGALFHTNISEALLPYESVNVDIPVPIFDDEINADSMDIYLNQQIDANAQTAIAAIETDLRNFMTEYTDFQAIIAAIKRQVNARLQIRTQPITRQRFRYREKVIRYLKGSRQNPLSINLPILHGCLTKPDQSIWIQATLVTTRNNPGGKVYLHQHQMVYNGENAQQNGLGSFRIPLTKDEINQRIKTFRCLFVFKTNQQDYRFELVPFHPLISGDYEEYYTFPNDDQLTKVQKSKCFDLAYHTEEFRIIFQLLIKQADEWYATDLYCETDVVTDINH